MQDLAQKSDMYKMQLIAGLCKKSYAAYVSHVHKGAWHGGKFPEFLCERIQEFIERPTDKPYEILVISTPPQHGKSMTVTETLPSWINARWPDKRVIIASYNDNFAVTFGRRNRRKIDEHGELFGVRLSKASDRDYEIADHRGGVISRGIMSGITGNPAEVILIDDPIKNRLEADSETYRERLWEEWQNSIKTRTQAGSKVILIQTRWHEDDLAGRIIEREKDVEVINLPCEAEENDPLGRSVGDPLFPEIGKDAEWLAQFKASYTDGTRAWQALFQGRPSAQEGNLLKRHWWQYYDILPQMMYKLISVDAAFKDAVDSDYVVIGVWGKRGADSYLIDLVRARMDFPATVKALRVVYAQHQDARCILIEDKANGSAIISTLQHEIPGILPVNPEGGKEARANAVSGYIEAGNVFLPRYASFTDCFVDECAAFPTGTYDDQVDMMSQALYRLYFRHADVPTKTHTSRLYSFSKPPGKKRAVGYGDKIREF